MSLFDSISGRLFFTGHFQWAVSGKVWQKARAVVAVGAVYTLDFTYNPDEFEEIFADEDVPF